MRTSRRASPDIVADDDRQQLEIAETAKRFE